MTLMLDLNLRAFARRRGEITGVGTWLKMDEQWRPCMALLRANEELNGEYSPYVVTMDRAWVWDETIGDGAEALRQCINIAQALRLGEDMATLFRIRTFIADHLGDLLSIPPLPPAARPGQTIAEVTITNRNTGETHEVELKDV